MILSNILFILILFLFEFIKIAFITYILNKFVLYLLSHFFAGESNYSQIFFQNEWQLFLINIFSVFIMEISQTVFVFIFANAYPESTLGLLSHVLHYSSYLVIYILNYKLVFKKLYTDVWGIHFITLLYTGLMLFLDVIIHKIF